MKNNKEAIILCESICFPNTIFIFRPEKKNDIFYEYKEIKVLFKSGKFLSSSLKLKIIEKQAVNIKIAQMLNQ